MKFFEAVPDELFSPLASPNRALYADALDVLYTAYREKLKLPEDMQTFNLYEESEEVEDPDHPTFVTYWKAAGALYDIIEQSNALFRQRENAAKLGELAIQALHHIILLREAKIPERYWYPDIMNWLLFKWYQNRNYNLAYLLKLYDEHEKNDMNKIEKLKLQNRAYRYQHSVKKLLRY